MAAVKHKQGKPPRLCRAQPPSHPTRSSWRRCASASKSWKQNNSACIPCWFQDSKPRPNARSEEHTSELQSLMRISYAVFCLKKKKHKSSTYIRPHTTLHIIIN